MSVTDSIWSGLADDKERWWVCERRVRRSTRHRETPEIGDAIDTELGDWEFGMRIFFFFGRNLVWDFVKKKKDRRRNLGGKTS